MADPKYLYQWVEFFRLLIDGVYLYIEEPIGWDKINISGKRDKDVYGLNYEFVDEKLNMIFEDHHGGGNEIRALYDDRGSDHSIRFEFGYYELGNPVVQYAADLNFNDFRDGEQGIEISLQKIFFESLLRTRYETKIAMDAVLSLDGETITPPTALTLNLHSKKIIKKSKGENATPDQVSNTSASMAATMWLQPATDNISIQELNLMSSLPVGVSAVDPFSELRYQFEAEEAGLATFTFAQNYYYVAFGSSTIGNWYLVPQIRVYRAGALIRTIEDPLANSSGTAGNILSTYHNFQITGSHSLEAGDVVYFLIKFDSNAAAFFNRNHRMQNYNGTVEVTQETVAASSTCTAYKLFDCLNHVVQAITGRADRVQSAFLGAGGCGEKYAIATGFHVRNFNPLSKPALMSMKDLIEGACPLWNLAVQYSKDADGDDIILIEPLKEFFQDERIMLLDGDAMDFISYQEEHLKDFTYNEAETGFTKFAENEINSLDDANTTGTWLLPMKTYKQKLTKKSTFIGSGWSIEEVRREQFKANPSSSMSSDDDLFIISYITERIHRDVSFAFFSISKGLQFSKKVNLIAGDQVIVNKNGGGGANDGITYTIQGRNNNFPERYRLTTFPFTDSGIGSVDIVITNPEAEKNEAFDAVENVFSGETAYNLRITPKEILFNHSELLNCCLEKKEDDDEIKNTYFKSNGALSKRFSPSASCNLRDTNPDFMENEVIPLIDFNSRRALFMCRKVVVKVKMNFDDFIFLKKCITGHSFTSKDFGVVAFPDPHGDLWEGYVWEFEYLPDEEICELKLFKKRKII
jgi:hypothetical protein